MLPLSPDSLALLAAIGLIDPLGFSSLGGCLPLPLSLRGTTIRAFSGYRAVLGTRSLHITVAYLVFCDSARLLFSQVEWDEGCWGEIIRPSVVSSIRKNQPIASEGIYPTGGRTCSDCLLLL